MIFKIIYPVNLVKKRNEPIWSRRACVELRDPVRSRGIEPDCVRPNEPNFTLFLVLFLFPLCHFTFLPNEPNFKKYTENVNICGSKNPPPAYLLIVTPG